MCKTCNNTGGININFGWYAEFHPCKNPDCDYDRDADIKESEALIRKMRAEIKGVKAS